ncbi:MAG TPA: tryptophan synthase subunit alpha [Pyrinomonadaceae bacterium]|jgi:tryptophan synthase alpha chain|nr:tryptophan synthase subunit alpha [Pyrinomonadaceae bacterium]
MSRIAETFARLRREGRRGFIPFITAGDPCLEMTRELLIELAHAGASLIELGVPFSDPVADGPVIQRASERALKYKFGLDEIMGTVASAQKEQPVPVVLFSYFNPLLSYGVDRLSREARSAGIDGVLVTDLVPEEAAEFNGALRAQGLDMIFLVAPTSTDARLSMVAERASGFIYAVSRAGVTGARADMSRDAEQLVARVRSVSDLPVAVGFGISNAEQVADVWRYADAAVVGSAIVAEIERLKGDPKLVERVGEFARALIPAETGSYDKAVRSG